jgi:hypothetical protein
MGWKRVRRCKECGRIYESGIPYICKKCGAEIGRPTPALVQALGGEPVMLTDKCETVIARKELFGWKVREREDEEVDESDSEVSRK